MKPIDVNSFDRISLSSACVAIGASLIWNSFKFMRRRRLRVKPVNSKTVDIVIARYEEDLTWLTKLRDILPNARIFIYNKGGSDVDISDDVHIKSVPNVGREGETYARHMHENYDDLADINIFLQADPFPHAPYLIDTLKDIVQVPQVSYQSLSLKYLNEVPPTYLLRKENDSAMTREQLISSYTLNSIEFHDEGTVQFYNAYLNHHNLPVGINVMKHFLDSIDVSSIIEQDTKLIRFAYAALFACSSDAVRRHSRITYSKLQKRVSEDLCIGYILERAWGLLFNGKLNAST